MTSCELGKVNDEPRLRDHGASIQLSIIVPCYNSERYLLECIQSIQGQTLLNFEIVCVDDGSNDSTGDILNKLKSSEARAVVITQKNMGVSCARNVGVDAARGEFVYFLDSDDILASSNILERCCDLLSQSGADVLIGSANTFYESAEMEAAYPEFANRYQITHRYNEVLSGPEAVELLRRNYDMPIPPGTRMYRRDFLVAKELRFLEGYIHEDGLFALQSIYLASKVVVTSDAIYKRRIREKSIMTCEISHMNTLGYIESFKEGLRFLESHRDTKRINSEIGASVAISKRMAVSTYLKLDQSERDQLYAAMNDEQRFYFETFVKSEAEALGSTYESSEGAFPQPSAGSIYDFKPSDSALEGSENKSKASYNNGDETPSRAGKPHPPEQQAIPYLVEHFADSPEWLSGWLHEFTCPECSSLLCFKPDVCELERGWFLCPKCNCRTSGESYSAAWVYQYRQWYAEQLMNAAICPDERAAAEYLGGYIDFYANNYSKFPLHGDRAGQGRIMAQSLDEAVFGIHLIRAIHYCRSLVKEEQLLRWKDRLFYPMVELLEPQVSRIHNISVWIDCFIAMVGLLYQDETLISQSTNGEYGLIKQLEAGLTRDFLWREGSIHYHYYALEALTYLCELCAFFNRGKWLTAIVEKMYLSPLGLSHDGYELPSINDGWHPLTLSSYGPQIACASILTGDKRIAQQVEVIRSHAPGVLNDPGYQALKMNYASPRAGNLRLDGHIGIIEDPFRIMLKSGSVVYTHSHHDCLSITIDPISSDLGTPGYGSSINNVWYRESLSHNTFSIDGLQSGNLLKSAVRGLEEGLEAELFGAPDNDIIKAIRRLTRQNGCIVDEMVVECAKEHVIDWTLHLRGDVRFSSERIPAGPLGEGVAYQLFEVVEKIEADNILHVSCTTPDGMFFESAIRIETGMQVYTALTPGNPASEKRQTILLRVYGNRARFHAEHSMQGNGQ